MNYTTTEKEIKVLDFQIFVSIVFLITSIVSILITYNESQYLKKGKRILNVKDSKNINKINRIIIVLLLVAFIYINYQIRDNDVTKGEDITADNLEILASILSLVAGLIVLYIVFKYGEDALTTTENPNI